MRKYFFTCKDNPKTMDMHAPDFFTMKKSVLLMHNEGVAVDELDEERLDIILSNTHVIEIWSESNKPFEVWQNAHFFNEENRLKQVDCPNCNEPGTMQRVEKEVHYYDSEIEGWMDAECYKCSKCGAEGFTVVW